MSDTKIFTYEEVAELIGKDNATAAMQLPYFADGTKGPTSSWVGLPAPGDAFVPVHITPFCKAGKLFAEVVFT